MLPRPIVQSARTPQETCKNQYHVLDKEINKEMKTLRMGENREEISINWSNSPKVQHGGMLMNIENKKVNSFFRELLLQSKMFIFQAEIVSGKCLEFNIN